MSAQKINTTAINKHTQYVLTILGPTHATAKLATSWMDLFVEVSQVKASLISIASVLLLHTSIADIDECESSYICEHFCINNDGSFTCECKANHTKTQDHRNCLGKTMFFFCCY